MTQEQLSEILNVSRSTVSSWEVGRNYPDLETIIAIETDPKVTF
nr:helix-turn-helix transcriptional regulator [Vagococcus teuberi]